MTAADALSPFIAALNLERLRIGPPRRFIFFCGGKIDQNNSRPLSLRDYLSRQFVGKSAIGEAHFVYAESATELYRDSGYSDLIGFEADVAQISDIVFIIGESAGSLTELGAFAMHKDISPRLKIFIREKHYKEESFIRNGPIRHMEAKNDDSVAAYPWNVSKEGLLVVSSAKPHLQNMRKELLDRLDAVSAKELFKSDNLRHKMILMYWIVQRLRGAILKEIVDSLLHFGIQEKQDVIRKYLYCMRVAEWIGERKYGHSTFYYPLVDAEPFEYAFKTDKPNDALRLKSEVAKQMATKELARPKPILDLANPT